MNILKLIQIYTITQLLIICISIVHAKEIQVLLPLAASGGNNNKLSTSEKTSEFSTTGYGLAYVFKNILAWVISVQLQLMLEVQAVSFPKIKPSRLTH